MQDNMMDNIQNHTLGSAQSSIMEQVNGDVKERDNIFVVELEVGNFACEEITASFHDGYLIVVGEKQPAPETTFQKAFYIGRNVSQENIRAAFHNGVLKCMIPKDDKAEVKEPTQIEIMKSK